MMEEEQKTVWAIECDCCGVPMLRHLPEGKAFVFYQTKQEAEAIAKGMSVGVIEVTLTYLAATKPQVA